MTRPLPHVIASARPNFMKLALLVRALKADGRSDVNIVHTGQHFDHDMNDVFSKELDIPQSDVRLQCGGGKAAGIAPEAAVHVPPRQSCMAFLNLSKEASLVLTDSEGLHEEATALGVPYVTMRENTERPITVEEGSNILAGTDPAVVLAACRSTLAGNGRKGRRPALWDGESARRIVDVLAGKLCGA